MTSHDEKDWPEGVTDALRRNAAEAPRISSREASRRIRGRIESRPPRRRHRLVLAAVGAAVLFAVLSLPKTTPKVEPPAPPAAPAEVVIGPLPENVMLWWLDAETPVYFVLAPPAPRQGGSS